MPEWNWDIRPRKSSGVARVMGTKTSIRNWSAQA